MNTEGWWLISWIPGSRQSMQSCNLTYFHLKEKHNSSTQFWQDCALRVYRILYCDVLTFHIHQSLNVAHWLTWVRGNQTAAYTHRHYQKCCLHTDIIIRNAARTHTDIFRYAAYTHRDYQKCCLHTDIYQKCCLHTQRHYQKCCLHTDIYQK